MERLSQLYYITHLRQVFFQGNCLLLLVKVWRCISAEAGDLWAVSGYKEVIIHKGVFLIFDHGLPLGIIRVESLSS